MRILVLSDIHANATALDAVLNAAKDRWDNSVCLGDVVGYGPDPNEVTAKLRRTGHANNSRQSRQGHFRRDDR